jgi:NAD(P)-dependent dehydrogenase (short-subunit alcohol dehydrogenase family)
MGGKLVKYGTRGRYPFLTMKNFEGKVAIVTGGSGGIGEAVALKFAREGAKVVIAAQRVDQGEAVVREIESLGSEGLFVQTDVAKRAEIEVLVEKTVDRFGRLDCAVNNAGIVGQVSTPVAEIDEASWDDVMNVNLKGVWMCMKYEIPAMLKHGKGAIVNISSIYGAKPSDAGHSAQNRVGDAEEIAEAIRVVVLGCGELCEWSGADGGWADTTRLY